MRNMGLKNNSLISIIVPVYNAEKFLKKCVNSIINQTYKNLEIILVDDGSTDNCPAILDKLKMVDSRIRIIHQENSGPMAACANGIENAKGEYIGFIDSDDWIEPNMYFDMISAANENNADLVQCGYILDCGSRSKEYLGISDTEIIEYDKIRDKLVVKLVNFWDYTGLIFSPSRCNKLITSELVKKNMKYCDMSLKMGEDLNLILPILLDCKKVVCLNKSYYHYVLNKSSTTQSYSENLGDKNKQLFRCIESICNIKNIEISEFTNKYFNYMTVLAIFNEYNSKDNFHIKAKNIITICKENPAKGFLNNYFSTDFDILTKVIIRLMIFKLCFLIPYVFRMVAIIKTLRKAIRKDE